MTRRSSLDWLKWFTIESWVESWDEQDKDAIKPKMLDVEPNWIEPDLVEPYPSASSVLNQ